ncbi:MAG: hypothetical protein Q9192_007864 [Flavoplaca navasiana]
MEALVLTQAIISVVSNFAFAALPIFFLWRTQIDFRTKIGLWVLMGLGVLTGFFCLIRTVINNQSFPEDVTYGGIVNWVWRLFEVSIGIIAACVPTLRPLYPWLKKRIQGGNMAVDPNIRFPLSDKPQPWMENVEEAKHSRREEISGATTGSGNADGYGKSRSPQPRTEHRGVNRDTLGEELVREGIINTDEPDPNTVLPADVRKHKPERAETALGQEMHKYGIDDSIV